MNLIVSDHIYGRWKLTKLNGLFNFNPFLLAFTAVDFIFPIQWMNEYTIVIVN